jgi:hypothetical protein
MWKKKQILYKMGKMFIREDKQGVDSSDTISSCKGEENGRHNLRTGVGEEGAWIEIPSRNDRLQG